MLGFWPFKTTLFNTIASNLCGWWVCFLHSWPCINHVQLSQAISKWSWLVLYLWIDSINYLVCYIKSRFSLFYTFFKLSYILITVITLSSWNQIGGLRRKVIMVVLLAPFSNEWDIVVYIRKYLLNFQQRIKQIQTLCSQSWVEFVAYTHCWVFTLSTSDVICRL
jgi:hypothetical protein